MSVCAQWTTDQDILAALRRAGYGMVRAIKMYENRGNGQFKGWVGPHTHFRHTPPLWLTPPISPAPSLRYAQVELDSEGEAIEAVEKIQEM